MFLGPAVVDPLQPGLSRAHGHSFSPSPTLSGQGLYSQLMSLLFNYCCASHALGPGSAKSSTSAFGHPQKANTRPENVLSIPNSWLLLLDHPEPSSGILKKCVWISPSQQYFQRFHPQGKAKELCVFSLTLFLRAVLGVQQQFGTFKYFPVF